MVPFILGEGRETKDDIIESRFKLEGAPQVIGGLKYAGWFERLSGLVFGRNNGPEADSGFTYKEAIREVFDGLDFPVILDAVNASEILYEMTPMKIPVAFEKSLICLLMICSFSFRYWI